MKLFQQLLVAPAALGMMSPLAVVNSPAANAAELNINGISDYAATASGNSLDQVTSVTPAITYLAKPIAAQDSDGLNAMSALVKTQFKF